MYVCVNKTQTFTYASSNVLCFYQAKLDVGVALLSTHRLLWRDVKNHVRKQKIKLTE